MLSNAGKRTPRICAQPLADNGSSVRPRNTALRPSHSPWRNTVMMMAPSIVTIAYPSFGRCRHAMMQGAGKREMGQTRLFCLIDDAKVWGLTHICQCGLEVRSCTFLRKICSATCASQGKFRNQAPVCPTRLTYHPYAWRW